VEQLSQTLVILQYQHLDIRWCNVGTLHFMALLAID